MFEIWDFLSLGRICQVNSRLNPCYVPLLGKALLFKWEELDKSPPFWLSVGWEAICQVFYA